ncbi:hypothetical protein EYB53_003890 [Candidatus Chloroploca sp. M-50]|uniref:HMA domain-containing protein n=1 Tax=Candidatus Chloroploca mongolica TaxID=2528176 RepID=A0ABS4D5Z2_9CHLR|nr:hypothetical protein [Candidatus Chloroploca mongolica]MBP1464845.1 hypothetical protein [Candidatus Chloroploca mongolica]
MILEILRIEQMRTERDRRVILSLVAEQPGIHHPIANLADRTLRFERDQQASLAHIIDALNQAGYAPAVLA